MQIYIFSALSVLAAAAVLIFPQYQAIGATTPLDALLSVQALPFLSFAALLAVLVAGATLFLKKTWLFGLLNALVLLASGLAGGIWLATIYESHQILPAGQGHWGLSNLYEVSVLLFAVVGFLAVGLARHYKMPQILPAAVALLAADALLLTWLGGLGVAGPRLLMPALQSYWLPWHVLANFLAYGCFLLAGVVGAWVLLTKQTQPQAIHLIDRCIALGFPLFTLAIILGALWANEAWGGYWSWDPKETWALIVWLVYAGYLHARQKPSFTLKKRAIWASAGFVITLICYLGVNLFMDGLHSYGKLPS